MPLLLKVQYSKTGHLFYIVNYICIIYMNNCFSFGLQYILILGERSNQCPSGFQLDPAGPYCAGKV